VSDPAAGWGEPWPEADAIFHRDALFRGADAAFSIDLGNGRVLWLFGDTFVAHDPGAPLDQWYFLRNSVAVQTGLDPGTASLRHHWRGDRDAPRSFFPEPDPDHWFWPAHGIRLGDTLLIFGEMMKLAGPSGPFNFAGDHAHAYVVDNPDDDPAAWRLRDAALPPDRDLLRYGSAVILDGDHLYVYAGRDPDHQLVLARFARAAAATGDLSAADHWCGDQFRAGCLPTALVTHGMPELSIHLDPRLDAYVMVGTWGFGSTTLVRRTAPRPWGPWSDVGDVYRPPESDLRDAFVYAGKAHPVLDGDGALVATYVPSQFGATLPDPHLYFPRFVRVHLR